MSETGVEKKVTEASKDQSTLRKVREGMNKRKRVKRKHEKWVSATNSNMSIMMVNHLQRVLFKCGFLSQSSYVTQEHRQTDFYKLEDNINVGILTEHERTFNHNH